MFVWWIDDAKQKKVFDSADYYKEKEESDKNWRMYIDEFKGEEGQMSIDNSRYVKIAVRIIDVNQIPKFLFSFQWWVLYVSLKEGPFLSFNFGRENKNNRYLLNH